jgi:hypothetical protein
LVDWLKGAASAPLEMMVHPDGVRASDTCSRPTSRPLRNAISVDSPAAGTAGACWARTAVEATTSNAAASRYVLRAIK